MRAHITHGENLNTKTKIPETHATISFPSLAVEMAVGSKDFQISIFGFIILISFVLSSSV
jgi:hypothetical protein